MQKIIHLIRTYFRQHFSLPYFIAILLLTGTLVFINYQYQLEEGYIVTESHQGLRLFKFCLMYFVAFGGAYLLQVFDRKNKRRWSVQLWLLILFSVMLFSVRAWFNHYGPWVKENVPYPYEVVAYKYIVNLQGFILLFIPCFIYWMLVDRKEKPIYGFHSKGVVLKPYFILLLLMAPIIIFATTLPGFLETYPRMFYLGMPEDTPHKALLTFIYELCYSADFVCTEFFFRGFLIIALARYAGPGVILPMCVFYVSIHFDKPLGETISSFFGGWILGILAYETGSIYGGIIVHLGIALLMEVVALVAHMM